MTDIVRVLRHDGEIVLGKYTAENGFTERTYANRTQATRAARRVGGIVIQRGRPFYVCLNGPIATENETFGKEIVDYISDQLCATCEQRMIFSNRMAWWRCVNPDCQQYASPVAASNIHEAPRR